ncbi:Hypothetical protein BSM4216_2431 [Bacillus smithii]|nr:Hypothetical protein BSM4216_2431 [Bacillus smithii]
MIIKKEYLLLSNENGVSKMFVGEILRIPR